MSLSSGVTAEQIEAALSAMPPARRKALQALLVVPPRHEKRTSYYDQSVHDCWAIAGQGSKVIVYSAGGLTGRDASDEWGVLSASDDSLGHDDRWYPTLDDAFMASGLCDRSLIPDDHEFS
jgi:hypothetical protein